LTYHLIPLINTMESLPVVLVAGFARSGKTSVIRNILEANSNSRVSVLCNKESDISSLPSAHARTLSCSSLCTCCSGRQDFVSTVRGFCDGKCDALVVECSSLAAPLQVAESFVFDKDGNILDDINGEGHLEGGGLGGVAHVTLCVVCVDAASFFDKLESIDPLSVDDNDSDDRDVAEVFCDSIEVATHVVLNSRRSESVNLDRIRQVIRVLNPDACIIDCVDETMPTFPPLKEKVFDFMKCIGKPRWMALAFENEEAHTMIYRGERPFHAKRLGNLIDEFFMWDVKGEDGLECVEEEDDTESEDHSSNNKSVDASELLKKRVERFGRLLRMKGILWITDHPERQMEVSTAGSMAELSAGQPWFYDFTEEQWKAAEEEFGVEDVADARRQVTLNGVWGDRRQEVVIVGEDINKDGLKKALDFCMLTDCEMKVSHEQWSRFGTLEDVLTGKNRESSCCNNSACAQGGA